MFNNYLNNIIPSASMQRGLSAADGNITNLAIGIPDINCPSEIASLVEDASRLNRFSYIPSKGTLLALAKLKEILFADEPSIQVDKNLLLVNGAKYGVYLSLKTLCNAGDVVIIMQPYWLSYPAIVHSLGLKFLSWNPKITASGELDYNFHDLHDLLVNSNVKAIIINNPNNPSGKVFRRSWIEDLVRVVSKHNCWLLIDEVYRDLTFESNLKDSYQISGDHIIRVGSFSKSLGIPGLRLGYISSHNLFIDKADLFNQHIQTCVNSISCYVLENINVELYNKFIAANSVVYESRYRVVEELFKSNNVDIIRSEASFYLLVNFKNHFSDGEAACDYLFEKLGIVAVPGRPYGDLFSSYIRVCLTMPSDQLQKTFKNLLAHFVHADL